MYFFILNIKYNGCYGYLEILVGLINKKTSRVLHFFFKEILVHSEKLKNCPLVQCVFDEKADNIN